MAQQTQNNGPIFDDPSSDRDGSFLLHIAIDFGTDGLGTESALCAFCCISAYRVCQYK